MKFPRAIALVVAICVAGFASGDPAPADPEQVPELFSPGALPAPAAADAAPAFTPDGNEVYIGRKIDGREQIVVSIRRNGRWSEAKRASFSGRYRDLEPAIEPHGRYLVFASSRPTSGAAPLDGRWSDTDQIGKGGNLWRVNIGDPRAVPVRLPKMINRNNSTFSPAVAASGALWFMRSDDGHAFHIFRAPMRAGKYLEPAPAPFTDPRFGDFDPAVAPDESFVIFSSSSDRAGTATHRTDLFITFRMPSGWTRPLDLAMAISPRVHGIEARLSPDCAVLYFTNSDGATGQTGKTQRYVWQVRLPLSALRRMSAG